jgi:hypothetical protein
MVSFLKSTHWMFASDVAAQDAVEIRIRQWQMSSGRELGRRGRTHIE